MIRSFIKNAIKVFIFFFFRIKVTRAGKYSKRKGLYYLPKPY